MSRRRTDGAEFTILVDDREKTPFEFPGVPTKTARLDVGDYSVCYGEEDYRDVFAIERKTLDDLTRSVGTDRDRFEAEIQRAASLSGFVVMISAHEYDCEMGNYYSQIHPNAVLGTLDTWSTSKYPYMDVEWAGSRSRAAQLTLYKLDRWFLTHNTGLI
jgi:ERCC4-type nuclease